MSRRKGEGKVRGYRMDKTFKERREREMEEQREQETRKRERNRKKE